MTVDLRRKCPRCRTTIPTMKLRPPYSAAGWRKANGAGKAGGLRQCPHCRYVGFIQAFTVAGGKPVTYAGMT